MPKRQRRDNDIAMERCRCRLKDLYMKRRSKIQFGSNRKSVTDLDNLFVDLELVEEGKIGVKYEEQSDADLDLLNIKDDKGNLYTHVLLRGYAGSGKTTVINKLAYGWAQCERDEPHETSSTFGRFRLVFVLDARRIMKGASLENAIRKQLLPNISSEEISNIFRTLEKLSLTHGEITSNIDRQWNKESSSKICPKLKDFSISLDLSLRWRGKSQSSKKCRDVLDIEPLISYIPSIETFMLSIYRYCQTDEVILFDKWSLNLNVTRTYKSMKILMCNVSPLICDNLEVSANMLANIAKRMPMLEILNVTNITVVGDVESSMGQLENLKEFKWTDSSIVENNLIMIKKLILCMPSLECFEIHVPYEITDYLQAWLNRLPKLTTLSFGRHQVAVDKVASTVASASVKKLTIVYRDDSTSYYPITSDDMDDTPMIIDRGDEHPKHLMKILCLMPSLELFTLVVNKNCFPFTFVDSNETVESMVESVKEFRIRWEVGGFWRDFHRDDFSSVVMTIIYLLRCMPQLQTFDYKGIDIYRLSNWLKKILNVSKLISLRACKLECDRVHGHSLIVFLASMASTIDS